MLDGGIIRGSASFFPTSVWPADQREVLRPDAAEAESPDA
jgi:hypothetical protein